MGLYFLPEWVELKKNNKIIVDFQRKETEAGWIRILDNFGLKATPVWFSWLSWILVMGAFQYLFERIEWGVAKTGLLIILSISVSLLWFYFNAIFFRVEFRGLPFIRGKRAWLGSMIVSGLLAFGSWRFAFILLRILKQSQH